jgi:hypothetical protein
VLTTPIKANRRIWNQSPGTVSDAGLIARPSEVGGGKPGSTTAGRGVRVTALDRARRVRVIQCDPPLDACPVPRFTRLVTVGGWANPPFGVTCWTPVLGVVGVVPVRVLP